MDWLILNELLSITIESKDTNNILHSRNNFILRIMIIRQTRLDDLASVMAMYDYARGFMKEHGNGNQWINGYPSEELIISEINAKHSFVCEDDNGELLGTFCYIEGVDPTYLKIYDGEWLNDEPYAVIHRMASNGKRKGIAAECLEWAYKHCDNLRVDTHSDNIVMQNLLTKHGFKRCGIIYVANGTERIAYHKIVDRG